MKRVCCLTLATAALLLFVAVPAVAGNGGERGFRSQVRGFKAQSQPGFRGQVRGFQAQPRPGFRGQAPGFSHGHVHHPSHGGAKFFVGFGPVWWWGWPGWPAYYPYYYPYYPYYPYPYYPYYPPAEYMQQETAAAPPYYWYYCEGAQAYYPYVQQCPGGWLQVVPRTGEPKPSNEPKPNN
jgi:hypothetical protein